MAAPVAFSLLDGEHIAIVGPNGGGKSMLVDMITGAHPMASGRPEYDFSPSRKPLVSDNIKHITFRDMYGGDNDRTYYLQQRWNQAELNDDMPTVGDVLRHDYSITGKDTSERRTLVKRLFDTFGMSSMTGGYSAGESHARLFADDRAHPMLSKYVILLSSGEMRKLRIIRALMAEPRVLIMDNPFIGLDAEARRQVATLMSAMSRERALQIILVISKTSDIPDFITHVVEVKGKTVGKKMTIDEYRSLGRAIPEHVLTPSKREEIINLPVKHGDYKARTVIDMRQLSIRYGARTIIDNLSWTVLNGERWALGGPNGSGKSTLLSLVCADNPQGYACDITLFDRKRGSGESIWDIKRHIGYVSPEMHRAYHHDMPAIRIVASGLHDSVGLHVRVADGELAACKWWMRMFGLSGLEDRPFLSLSSGQQRLTLLARAFVKDPELLILDEPLHGLDDSNCRLVLDIIETFCERLNKTLIMVTHYVKELPSCIDKQLILQKHI